MSLAAYDHEALLAAAMSGDVSALNEQIKRLSNRSPSWAEARERLAGEAMEAAVRADQGASASSLLPWISRGSLDSALQHSARRGQTPMLKILLIDSRADPDYNDGCPLQEAIAARHPQAFDLLLPLTRVKSCHLELAAANQDLDFLRKITEKVPASSHHSVALRTACQTRNQGAIDLLLGASHTGAAAAGLAHLAKAFQKRCGSDHPQTRAAWDDLDFLFTQIPAEWAERWAHKFGYVQFPRLVAHGRSSRAPALLAPASPILPARRRPRA